MTLIETEALKNFPLKVCPLDGHEVGYYLASNNKWRVVCPECRLETYGKSSAQAAAAEWNSRVEKEPAQIGPPQINFPEGYVLDEVPDDYTGRVFLEGQMRGLMRAAIVALEKAKNDKLKLKGLLTEALVVLDGNHTK